MILKSFNLSKEDYEYELEKLSFDAYDRVYDYYDDIIDKFKSRCSELYGMVGNQTIDRYIIPYINLEEPINKWTKELINSEDKESFIAKNNIPKITDELDVMINDIDSIITRSWNGAKELI